MAFPIYPGAKSYSNIPSGYPICTVTRHFPDGKLIPLYFGIIKNDERFRYAIKAIHHIMENGNIITFECSYQDSGRLRTVLLKFDVFHRRWYVG